MGGVATYEVTVLGFDGVLYSARSPGKARARCFRDYQSYDDRTSFGEFLKISRVRRVDDPPGCGSRILVNGRVATRVYDPRGSENAVHYMRDDSDEVFCCHPSEAFAIVDAEREGLT
jgi:hypothetical protein